MLIALAALFSGTAAAADTGGEMRDLAAPLIDWTDVQRSFTLVEEWVRAGIVPRANLPAIAVTGAVGVKVTLRTDGYTLGSGEAYRSDLAAATDRDGPAVDLVPLLADATRAALAGVEDRLADAMLKAVMEKLIDAGDARSRREMIGQKLLVDVQIARTLQTIRILPDAPPHEVFGRFAFDAQGLRLLPTGADPDQLGAVVWPASALASNIQPTSQLHGLLAGVDLPIEALAKVARPGGPVLQRFDVLHRVRPALDQSPVQLVRGNVPIHTQSINTAQLQRLSQRLFAHLSQRFVTDAVRGTFHPTTGRYDPPLAEPREVAFAAYAIQRYRNLLGDTASDLTRSSAERGVRDATDLGLATLGEGATFDPAVASLVVLTLLEAEPGESESALIEKLRTQLVRTMDTSPGRNELPIINGQPVTRPMASLMAAALITASSSGPAPRGDPASRRLLQTLWKATLTDPEVLSLYWLAIAFERASALSSEPDEAAAAQNMAALLGDLVDKLILQQVIEPPALGPDDVLGGFVLQRIAPGAPPTPDWRTAPLLGFLAVAMRDERVTTGRDAYGWLLTASLAARFVAQLTMDRPSAFYARGVDEALGGVRLALWDNTLAIEPTAASLLALVELQEAVAQMENGDEP